jgi:hypothetical protein
MSLGDQFSDSKGPTQIQRIDAPRWCRATRRFHACRAPEITSVIHAHCAR